MHDEARDALGATARDAFALHDDAEIAGAIEQIQTAFHRALHLVHLDDAASIAGQRKILSKLTPDDFRSGEPIDDAVRVRVGMHLPAGIFDLFTNDKLPDDPVLKQAIASAFLSMEPAARGRPTGTVSLAAR
jgi:hypothetical protein